MGREHQYSLTVKWTGNRGTGTSAYRAYNRSHLLQAENKPGISCSSDPAFSGDPSKYNPEELLVASISACHMLWFLHLCSESGVVVTDYYDNARGTMQETAGGGGHFSTVDLYPTVTVTESAMIGKMDSLHSRANQLCFIANSVNFPISHHPICLVLEKAPI
jgi:organic hydroperoxide reductase OsmC/OhrA